MSGIRTILRQLCGAFNAHDLDRIMGLFADDCILEMPRGNEPWGSRFESKENVRTALANRFEGLPHVRPSRRQCESVPIPGKYIDVTRSPTLARL